MKTKDYLVDQYGNFRFTSKGLENQTKLLAKAGIDAGSIKTFEGYLQARQAAKPFFLEYLQEEIDKQLEGRPDTIEWQAIRSIAYGSTEDQDQMLEKVRRKQSLKTV